MFDGLCVTLIGVDRSALFVGRVSDVMRSHVEVPLQLWQEAYAMPLLRVRFGLATLVCVVAVAGVNCAAVRFLVDRESDRNAPHGIGVAPEIIAGFLPLINAALSAA